MHVSELCTNYSAQRKHALLCDVGADAPLSMGESGVHSMVQSDRQGRLLPCLCPVPASSAFEEIDDGPDDYFVIFPYDPLEFTDRNTNAHKQIQTQTDTDTDGLHGVTGALPSLSLSLSNTLTLFHTPQA